MTNKAAPEIDAKSLDRDIATLKQSGDAGFDPVRFHFIEAMASRAKKKNQPVANVILSKANNALQQYRKDMSSQAEPEPQPEAPAAHKQLSALTALLNQQTEADSGRDVLEDLLQQQELELLQQFTETTVAGKPALVELKSARQFRGTLQQIGADRRVEMAAFNAPEDSGPLNPQMLITESLSQLRDLSPSYLSRFITYFDTLFWLEQASGKEDN